MGQRLDRIDNRDSAKIRYGPTGAWTFNGEHPDARPIVVSGAEASRNSSDAWMSRLGTIKRHRAGPAPTLELMRPDGRYSEALKLVSRRDAIAGGQFDE
jgi:hypothetical protein